MLISTVINNKYRETNNSDRWEYTQPAPAINHDDLTFIKDSTAELTDNILGSYETCINEQKSQWMSKLARNSMQYLADKRGTRLKRFAMKQYSIKAQSVLLAIYLPSFALMPSNTTVLLAGMSSTSHAQSRQW